MGIVDFEREVMRAAHSQQLLRDRHAGRARFGMLQNQMNLRLSRLEPAAGKRELGPLGRLHAEHARVEGVTAFEVLYDQRHVVEGLHPQRIRG